MSPKKEGLRAIHPNRSEKKETKEEERHRFKVIDQNPELVKKARSGNLKAIKHLNALIYKEEIDPEWLIEDKEPEMPIQEMIMNNNPYMETRVTIFSDKLKVVIKDRGGNIMAMDMCEIKSIHRVSYNPILNQLIIVLPEFIGSIEEIEQPIMDNKGNKTGASRRAIHGNTGPYKFIIATTEVITAFLKSWMGEKDFIEHFDGFKLHEESKKKFEEARKAAEKKEKEDQENKEKGETRSSSILDETGEPAKKS